MSTAKAFLYILFQSMYSPRSYLTIIHKPLTFTFIALAVFSTIISIIKTGLIYRDYIAPRSQDIAQLPQTVSQILPEDLTILIDNGQVQINQPMPYIIPIDRLRIVIQDSVSQVLGMSTDQIQYLLVIDTTALPEEITRYPTLALLTHNFFVYKDISRSDDTQLHLKVIPLDGMTLMLNQQIIRDILIQFSPLIGYGVIGLVLLIACCLFIITPNLLIVYSLIIAFIPLLIARILRISSPYPQAFQLALHLAMVLSLWDVLFQVVIDPLPVPLLRTSAIILASMYILLLERSQRDYRRQAIKV